MNSSDDQLPGPQVSDTQLPNSEVPGNKIPDNQVPGERISQGRRTAWTGGVGVSGSVQSLLGTVVIAVFVITFIVQAFQIPSPSMENTLLVGDYLLVNKLCYGGSGLGDYLLPYRRIRRGDIVVFHYPVNPAQHFVKRVIGIPGDRVRLINKQVLVNGAPLREPYAHFSRPSNDAFRDSFPRLDVAAGETPEWWVQLRKLVEDGQLIVPRGTLFCDGRQSGRQLRQPVLGIRATSKHYWTAAFNLLVGARGRERSNGAELGSRKIGAFCLCGDAHFSDHALEPDAAAGELNSPRLR